MRTTGPFKTLDEGKARISEWTNHRVYEVSQSHVHMFLLERYHDRTHTKKLDRPIEVPVFYKVDERMLDM